jgi:thioredoxin-like negative regulator of GroEL
MWAEVDINENRRVAEKLKVKSLPSFVFFKDGEKIEMQVSYDDDLIKEMLRQRKAAGTLNETKFDKIETEASEED